MTILFSELVGLIDGCRTNGAFLEPSVMTSESQVTAIRCCNDDNCVSPSDCPEVTYSIAKEKCADIGRRICTSDELYDQKCCGTGCNFDYYNLWAQIDSEEDLEPFKEENKPWQ